VSCVGRWMAFSWRFFPDYPWDHGSGYYGGDCLPGGDRPSSRSIDEPNNSGVGLFDGH
jgi:hypothetical protein